MASISKIVQNEKRRVLISKYSRKREDLKRKGDFASLDKLPKNSSPVRYRNRCGITGRPRGFIRRFGVCRNVFRELVSSGYIPGVEKSSW